MPTIEEDLHTVAEQERLLQFESFGADTAWAVGSALRADAIARQAGMTFEIQIAGRVLFACSTDTASAGQADWIRRKRNTVMRFGKSSYAVGLQIKLEGKDFAARHEISLADYRGARGRISYRAERDRPRRHCCFKRPRSAHRSCNGSAGVGHGARH